MGRSTCTISTHRRGAGTALLVGAAGSVRNTARMMKTCATAQITDQADLRMAANRMWLAAREDLRRHSIAERASQQIAQRDADTLGDLQMEYELEASALLGLKQAMAAYQKLRPETRG